MSKKITAVIWVETYTIGPFWRMVSEVWPVDVCSAQTESLE